MGVCFLEEDVMIIKQWWFVDLAKSYNANISEVTGVTVWISIYNNKAEARREAMMRKHVKHAYTCRIMSGQRAISCIWKQEEDKSGNSGGLKERCWNDCSFLFPPGWETIHPPPPRPGRWPLLEIVYTLALSHSSMGGRKTLWHSPLDTIVSPGRTAARRASSEEPGMQRDGGVEKDCRPGEIEHYQVGWSQGWV